MVTQGEGEPAYVGRVTTLKNPYTGPTPTYFQPKTRVTPEISGQSVYTASDQIQQAHLQEQGTGKSFRNFLTDFYEKLFQQKGGARGIAVNGLSMDGQPYVVAINKSAVAKVISDKNMSPEKLSVLDVLDSVIENGEYVGSNRYIPKGRKIKDTIRFDLFETPVRIDGQDYIIAFDVEVFPSTNNYRTHKVINEMDLIRADHTDTGTHPPHNQQKQGPFPIQIIAPELPGGKSQFNQTVGTLSGAKPLPGGDKWYDLPGGARGTEETPRGSKRTGGKHELPPVGEAAGEQQKTAPQREAGYNQIEADAIRHEGRTFRNLVAGIDSSVSAFFERWKSGRKNQQGEKLEKLYLGKMSDKVKQQVASILGYDVDGRDFIITNDDVKHIMDEHGDSEAEIRKGNLPLDTWALDSLQDVVANPDSITPGHIGEGKKNAWKLGVVFTKSFPDGRVVCILFDNKGRGTMEVATMYVKKGNTTSEIDANKSAPIHTSETPEPVLPFNTTLPRGGGGVNTQDMRTSGELSGDGPLPSGDKWYDLPGGARGTEETPGGSKRTGGKHELPPVEATAGGQQKTASQGEAAVRVGQGTILKNPYTGDVPIQGDTQNRVTPTVPDALVDNAKIRIGESEQGARQGAGAFKNLLTKAYEAVFHSVKRVPVDGVTFQGGQYYIDINNGVPGKVISDVNHAPEKLALLEMLPEIVTNGTFVGSTNGKKKITRYDHFETQVTISGRPYLVLFEAEVYPGSNNYKTHRLINMELIQHSGEVTGTPPASPKSASAPYTPIIAGTAAGSNTQSAQIAGEISGAKPLSGGNKWYDLPGGARGTEETPGGSKRTGGKHELPPVGEAAGGQQKTASPGETESTAVNTNPAVHTPEEQAVIDEYQSAVDSNLVDFYKEASKGQSGEVKGYYPLKAVSDRMAADVLKLVERDITGFSTHIDARQAWHIKNDHGPKGKADHSMQDPNDVGRIQYVLDHYDEVFDGGRTDAYWEPKGGGRNGQRQARTVVFAKKVNGTYYVVEAVPITKAKTVNIVSAYMLAPGKTPPGHFSDSKGKKTEGKMRLPDADAPWFTAKTDSAYGPSVTDTTVPQGDSGVNTQDMRTSGELSGDGPLPSGDKWYDLPGGARGTEETPGGSKRTGGKHEMPPVGEAAGGQQKTASQGEAALKQMTMADFTDVNSPVWTNVEYGDTDTQSRILRSTHLEMVGSGRVVQIPEATTGQIGKSFPDLRSMKKAERTPILRQKMNELKRSLRQFLGGLKGGSYEFEVNGNVLEAKLYDTGIREVMEKITQDKASMLLHSDRIFQNAQYLYSTPDYDGDPSIYRWNYFYTPVQIGDQTVGVRIAVRDVVKGTDLMPESQIYNWGIKTGATLDGGSRGPKVASSGVSSVAPVDATLDTNVSSATPSAPIIAGTAAGSNTQSAQIAGELSGAKPLPGGDKGHGLPGGDKGPEGFGANTVGAAESGYPSAPEGPPVAQEERTWWLPTGPIINFSMEDIAALTRGVLPGSGNYLREMALERAGRRLGIDENRAAYIPVNQLRRGSEAYVVKISQASLHKLLPPTVGGAVSPEAIVVLENIEQIISNGVCYQREGWGQGRNEPAGRAHLTARVYIDGEPYVVDKRGHVYGAPSGGENRATFFVPEEMSVTKK